MILSLVLRRVEILLLIVGLHSLAYAQARHAPALIDISKSASCEYVSAIFDSFVQGTPTDKTIIVIGYKGRSETKNQIVQRRLHNAKTYLTEYYKATQFSRPAARIITALGLGLVQNGKLEFYVDGDLKLSISMRDNRDLALSPCYLETRDYCKDKLKRLFYPCLK